MTGRKPAVALNFGRKTMANGDELQFAYHVPAAVLARIEAVNQPEASAYDWHQLGVCLAELAVSAQRIMADGWLKIYDSYLDVSLRCYGMALSLLREGSPEYLAVQCDSAMAIGRKSTCYLDNRGDYANEAACLLADLIRQIERLDNTPDTQHQSAIAHGFLAMIHDGREALGFMNVRPDGVVASFDLALHAYFKESKNSPDGRQAWRSMLIDLAYARARFGERFRRFTLRPLVSAIAHRDRVHTVRCLAILFLGWHGERLLRRRRDGRFLATYSSPQQIPDFPKLS